MLSGQSASNRAHLRSHSGRNAGVVFAHAPTAPEFVVPPHLFRVLFWKVEETSDPCGTHVGAGFPRIRRSGAVQRVLERYERGCVGNR